MSARPIVNAANVRPPLNPTALVDVQTGAATPTFDLYLRNNYTVINQLAGIDPTQFGARGNGVADDSGAFNAAIAQAVSAGGGVITVPAGAYSIANPLKFPAGNIPIAMVGTGQSSVILRGANMPQGVGLLDVSGSNVAFQDFLIDGVVTVPQQLQYNKDFIGIGGNDPMSPVLTANTSVWVHGGVSGFYMSRVTVQHSGGYGVLLDATLNTIDSVDIIQCWFLNNRPFLFGLVPGQLIYGAWGGGIFAKGDGRTTAAQIVDSLLVALCRFHRNTGNCLWSHLYGLNRLHENFRFIGNHFLDCGLDGIEVGGVTGGAVSANVLRRVGYVCTDDTSQSIPRWLVGLPATAIDSSGIVKGVPYADNSMTSINGGCLDLDGHGLGAISGNICRTPFPDEPEYVEDQIAITGPNNAGDESYGVNIGNTQQTAEGASDIDITGNTFINLRAGSARLYSARRVNFACNLIIAPDNSTTPPVAMGPQGPNPNQRCYDNRVCHNHVEYSPGTPGAPVVFEDDTTVAFLNTEKNYVFGNVPIITTTTPVEFVKAPSSGSTVYAQTVWFP